jgi:internalin A
MPSLLLQENAMRWSLGAMLAVLTVSGAARADEAAAVKLIEKLGGTITRDDKQPGKPVIEVDLAFTPATDANMKELKDLKQLKTLYLSDTQVTDLGLH